MERETRAQKFGAHELVVKTYASGREANAIQQAYLKGSKVEIVGEQPKISEFNPAVQQEVEKEMITQMAVSLDGSSDNLVERCLDLPSDIYYEMIQYLDTLVSKKKN